MEATRVSYRAFLRLPVARVESDRRFPRIEFLGSGDNGVPARPGSSSRRLRCQFSDSDHVQYYSTPKGAAKKEENRKGCETKRVKKKLKFIKRLSQDLALLPLVAYSGGDGSGTGLVSEVKDGIVSDAAEVLLTQLRQLRSEQKELKRKLKEEKAQRKLKTSSGKAKAKNDPDSSSSSSSSSDSSDSECGEIIKMTHLRGDPMKQLEDIGTPKVNGEALVQQEKLAAVHQVLEQGCCSRSASEHDSNYDQSNGILEWGTKQKIEICVGGKCKKMGAGALLEEFERKLGPDGAVVGCKCMGKCKNAPNVRVLNVQGETEARKHDDSLRHTADRNHTCTGVRLEDVDLILANLVGKDQIASAPAGA